MNSEKLIAQRAQSSIITAKQAASYLKVSAAWLEKARSRGSGPKFIKIGSRVLYDVADIDAWLASKKREHT
jgi:predicted DNA-binding transcriptional regulator AlpA